MSEIEAYPDRDESGVEEHLRRVLTPPLVAADGIVARALAQRRSPSRLVLVPAAGLIILAGAGLAWRAWRGSSAARPVITVVTVGKLVVASTPSGTYWITDREGAASVPAGRHLVVRREEGQ